MAPGGRPESCGAGEENSGGRVSGGASDTGTASIAVAGPLSSGRTAARDSARRIPLRLALERLAHEGLLGIRRTRGFIVQQFSAEDIFDAIELRGTLEGVAARLAAERLRDAGDLAAMYNLDREMRNAVEGRGLTLQRFSRYVDLNAEFHAGLLALARSRLLERAMEQVCCLPFASPSAFLQRHSLSTDSRELLPIALDHHRQILQAIEKREAARAESLTREHARLARRNLENALKNQELLRLVPGAKLIQLREAG
jgi:GntR family transcriptional regulator of vanillate catabolism